MFINSFIFCIFLYQLALKETCVMRKMYCLVLKFILLYAAASAETFPINKQLFFVNENVIEVTLTTDIKKLRADKKEPSYQPANIVLRFADSSVVSEEIRIQ